METRAEMIGYEKLMAAVKKDCDNGEGCFNPNGCDKISTVMVSAEGEMKKYTKTVCKRNVKCWHKYCDKFKWVIDQAKHYAEKLNLPWEEVLNSWENDRGYWYMSYYQEANQPTIKGEKIRVFDTVDELKAAIEKPEFRCSMCGGISKSPYECDSGMIIDKNKVCDWKVYGLFRDLGKGVYVYVKSELRGQQIFMPVAWERGKQ